MCFLVNDGVGYIHLLHTEKKNGNLSNYKLPTLEI